MSILRDVELLLKPAIEEIESTYNWQILVDAKSLEECAIKAEETLGNIRGIPNPNIFKIAGHYAFWIRKLKPFSLFNKDELIDLMGALGIEKPETILPNQSTSIPSGSKTLFVNEVVAIGVACGLVAKYSRQGSKIRLSAPLMNDWIIGLRYHSYSPSSLAILLEGLAQCPLLSPAEKTS